jgi:O-methyltransferase
MKTIYEVHQRKASARAATAPTKAGVVPMLRSAYKAIVPRKARYWRYRAQVFVFDHGRYRYLAEEGRPRRDFFRRAFTLLTENGISGDYMEFGCASGTTFGYAYRYARRAGHPARLWAFDSFEGLPFSNDPRDRHPLWQEGNFAAPVDQFLEHCAIRGIPANRIEVVKGFYSDTLSPESAIYKRLPTDIAFTYVDCDLYTSTKSVLDFLAPRLKHGMILAFDDYFCVSSQAVAGERLAFLEMESALSRFNFLPYIQFGTAATSFIIEERSMLQH